MRLKNSVLLLSFLLLSLGVAVQAAPDCQAGRKNLAVDNPAVIGWKATSREQFHARARISGTITDVYSEATGHIHVQATIGPNPTDTIEVIYNEDFGRVGRFDKGSSIEACGDYITARLRNGRYPPSPDGAIIHWVHKSTSSSHESGFMIIDGVVYGQ